MEVLAAKICRGSTSMTVKDCKKTLAMDSVEWSNENMGVFHFGSLISRRINRTCVPESFQDRQRWVLHGED